jgi:hypothetical protein
MNTNAKNMSDNESHEENENIILNLNEKEKIKKREKSKKNVLSTGEKTADLVDCKFFSEF